MAGPVDRQHPEPERLMATQNGVSVVKDGLPRLAKAVQRIAKRDVLVGIPDDRTRSGERRGPQEGKNAREDGGPVNALLARVHNDGAPDIGIPKREFLAPGIREGRARFEPHLAKAAAAVLAGDEAKAERHLYAAGLEASSAIKMKIKTGPFAPLAASTIAARRRRSKGSTYRRKATSQTDVTPLIDTAQMQRAVTFVVRKG